jgi:hypothetical protein
MGLGRFFVELGGFSLFNSYRVLRTVPDTCPQTVTVDLTNKLCLAIDNLYGALGAGVNTQTTAVTFFLVYLD